MPATRVPGLGLCEILYRTSRSRQRRFVGKQRKDGLTDCGNENRRGYANGFKPKTVKTRVGEVTFDIPQVREGDFYPRSLEKGIRSERALMMTLAEMYVQGVSTRR